MNEYFAQAIARQRMDETARRTRFAHHAITTRKASSAPTFSWRTIRHPLLARASSTPRRVAGVR
jgi:hypothetical protein